MVDLDKKALIEEVKNSSLSPLEKYIVLYRKAIMFAYPTFIQTLKELLDKCGYVCFLGDCKSYKGEYQVIYLYLSDPKYNFYGLHCVHKDDDPDQFIPFSPVAANNNLITIGDTLDDTVLLHGIGYKYLRSENEEFLSIDQQLKLESFLKLNIDKDAIYKESQDLVKNHKKEAICRLFNVFSRLNTPNDIYVKLNGRIVEGSSLESLLAMALLDDFMLYSFAKRLTDYYVYNISYESGNCVPILIDEFCKKYESTDEYDELLINIIYKRKIADILTSSFKSSEYYKTQYHLEKEVAINLFETAFTFEGLKDPRHKAELVVEINSSISSTVLDNMDDLKSNRLTIDNVDDEFVFDNLDAYNLFVLLRVKEVKLSLFRKLIDKLEAIRSIGIDYYVSIDIEEHNFTFEDFCVFEQAKSLLKEKGSDLFFFGGHSMFHTLDEMKKTDKILDDMIKKINSFGFSPFEKFLYIYNFVCSRAPKEFEHDHESPHLSRDLMSVVTTPYCVCVGFSQMLLYLCRETGIECFYQLIDVSEGDNHENDLVYLDDDKYDIHGLYYADSCWDSIDEEDKTSTYAFCLIPLSLGRQLFKYHFESTLYLYQDPKDKYTLLEPSLFQICLTYDPGCKTRINAFIPLGNLETELFLKSNELCRKECSSAFEFLFELFKEYQLPKETYYKIDMVPLGTSLQYLLANYIVDKDVDYIKSQVKILKEYVVKQLETGSRNLDLKHSVRTVLFEPYDEMSLEIEESSILFTSVRDAIYRIMLDKEIRNRLTNCKYTNLGKGIEMETFRKALLEVYTKQGLSKEEAEKKIEASFNKTKRYVRCIFKDGSSHKFYEKVTGFANLLKDIK